MFSNNKALRLVSDSQHELQGHSRSLTDTFTGPMYLDSRQDHPVVKPDC